MHSVFFEFVVGRLIKLKLVMGGLRPFNTEKAIDMADFLKEHWVEINKRTNQEFSYKILSDSTFIYDTEPAARAVVTARNMNSEIEFEFFKAVQIAFYKDNSNTNEIATYLQLADSFNLNKTEFETLFNSDKIKQETKADFQIASQMGVRGFPALVLKKGQQFISITNGYQTAEQIEKLISNQ